MEFLGKVLSASVIGLLFLSNSANAETQTTTTPNQISAPKEAYPLLYTMNAQYGLLVKSNGAYHITLHDTTPQVVYKNAAGVSGMVKLRQFIKHLQNKSAVIKADITGVQSNKTIGQTSFYASFTLSHPVLSTKDDIVRFEAKPLNEADLKVAKSARFDNATVFINGCTICECQTDHQNCVK